MLRRAGLGGKGSESTGACRGAAASKGTCAVELVPSRGAGWRAGPGLYVEMTRFPSCAGEGEFPSRTHRGCRRNRPFCGESAALGAQRGGHFIQRTGRVADAEPDPLVLQVAWLDSQPPPQSSSRPSARLSAPGHLAVSARATSPSG